jgi:hypothetical protein
VKTPATSKAQRAKSLITQTAAAFDTAALRQHSSNAVRAVVHAGSEPVGLVIVNGGRTVLVTDSDRGLVAPPSGLANVSVVSTAAALARRSALVGVLPAGLFPRELSYDAAEQRPGVEFPVNDGTDVQRPGCRWTVAGPGSRAQGTPPSCTRSARPRGRCAGLITPSATYQV